MAQSLLSHHMRQLEVELHQTLLLRNGRGVSSTEAGQVLLEHGRGILHQVALAREELGSVSGALAGHVSIGLPPSLIKLIAVPLTKAFCARLPQAQLTLTAPNRAQLPNTFRILIDYEMMCIGCKLLHRPGLAPSRWFRFSSKVM